MKHWLKFYDTERIRHPAEFNTVCDDPHAALERLRLSSGFDKPIITSNISGPMCYAKWNYIRVRTNTGAIQTLSYNYRIEFTSRCTWGAVAHEFAHLLDVRVYGRHNSPHDRKLARIIDELLNTIHKERLIERANALAA